MFIFTLNPVCTFTVCLKIICKELIFFPSLPITTALLDVTKTTLIMPSFSFISLFISTFNKLENFFNIFLYKFYNIFFFNNYHFIFLTLKQISFSLINRIKISFSFLIFPLILFLKPHLYFYLQIYTLLACFFLLLL